MKRLIMSLVFLFLIIGLSGCYTIPHHFADDNESEQVIIYYEVTLPPPPIIDYYPPVPPTPPVTNPQYRNPNPPLNVQPEKPKDSYNPRDPLRGGSNRGNELIKTDPPVRTSVQKDRNHK